MVDGFAILGAASVVKLGLIWRRVRLSSAERVALEAAQLVAKKLQRVPDHHGFGAGLTVGDVKALANLGSRLGVKAVPPRQRLKLTPDPSTDPEPLVN